MELVTGVVDSLFGILTRLDQVISTWMNEITDGKQMNEICVKTAVFEFFRAVIVSKHEFKICRNRIFFVDDHRLSLHYSFLNRNESLLLYAIITNWEKMFNTRSALFADEMTGPDYTNCKFDESISIPRSRICARLVTLLLCTARDMNTLDQVRLKIYSAVGEFYIKYPQYQSDIEDSFAVIFSGISKIRQNWDKYQDFFPT